MIFTFLRATEDELSQYLDNSALLESRIQHASLPDANMEDIDQSWEGILFLLTGQPLSALDHPLGAALFSGQSIDEKQDLGYGPANYLTPEQVREINDQLAILSTDELMSRYDPLKMHELGIYPSIWDRADDEVKEYLREYTDSVKDFYTAAARGKFAVITFLS